MTSNGMGICNSRPTMLYRLSLSLLLTISTLPADQSGKGLNINQYIPQGFGSVEAMDRPPNAVRRVRVPHTEIE